MAKRGATGKTGGTRKSGGGPSRGPARPKSTPRAKAVPALPLEPAIAPGPFVLGAVPGATPGKWIDRWNERMPRNPLTLEAIAHADQRASLAAVDAALVRLPIDRDGLHIIALYDDLPVVVASADSHLAAADELSLADLAGEVVIRPLDDVLSFEVPDVTAARFEPPATTADALAIVATGVGIVIVPMSLARLHHRRDVVVRPLTDGPVSPVALAWESERTTPLVDAFVGVVRGRTARSSRS